jgi:hypothetical protein
LGLRWALSISLIAVIFFVDFSVAMGVHTKINQANELIGLTGTNWKTSTEFYMILSLGFVAACLWSVLLHVCIIEWEKRSPLRQLNSVSKLLKKEIEDAKKKVDSLLMRLRFLNGVTEINLVEVRNQISAFKEGWLNGLKEKADNIDQCFDGFLKDVDSRMKIELKEKVTD